MARVCLFHVKSAEAQPLLAVLRDAGHKVDFKDRLADIGDLRTTLPDAVVIDLSRMPSHGRSLGLFLRGRKITRGIPIVFVDGDPLKVEATRRLLPDATYTPKSRLKSAVKSALAHPPVNPVKSPAMSHSWTSRSAAEKLGIKKDSRVAVIGPPPDYARAIGDLPEGVQFDEESTADCRIVLWFVHGPAEFQSALPGMRRLAPNSRLWIVWRKGKRDGLDGNLIRQSAIEVGLVDYKICSINNIWTAMVFAVKRSR